jgi:hypothetical protein
MAAGWAACCSPRTSKPANPANAAVSTSSAAQAEGCPSSSSSPAGKVERHRVRRARITVGALCGALQASDRRVGASCACFSARDPTLQLCWTVRFRCDGPVGGQRLSRPPERQREIAAPAHKLGLGGIVFAGKGQQSLGIGQTQRQLGALRRHGRFVRRLPWLPVSGHSAMRLAMTADSFADGLSPELVAFDTIARQPSVCAGQRLHSLLISEALLGELPYVFAVGLMSDATERAHVQLNALPEPARQRAAGDRPYIVSLRRPIPSAERTSTHKPPPRIV